MRKILTVIVYTIFCQVAHAQYLYRTYANSTSPRNFIRFNPASNADSTLFTNFHNILAVTTKDTATRRMFYVLITSPTAISDSVVTVQLSTNAVSQFPIKRGVLPLPQFDAEKLVSISAAGMGSVNLATHAYTILDSTLKENGLLYGSAFDHARRLYMYLKPSTTGIDDTLVIYDMITKTVTRFPLGAIACNELGYSPISNKVIFQGAKNATANTGIYSFDLSSLQLKFETALPNTGTAQYSGTMDEAGNRYFVTKLVNGSPNSSNVVEYRLNSSTLVNHALPLYILCFSQYFGPPRANPTGIGPGNEQYQLALYPNPATDYLNAVLQLKGEKASLEVTDMDGRSLQKDIAKDGFNQLGVSALPAGHYIFSVHFGHSDCSRVFEKR